MNELHPKSWTLYFKQSWTWYTKVDTKLSGNEEKSLCQEKPLIKPSNSLL